MQFDTTFEYVNYTLASLYNNIQLIEDGDLKDIILVDYKDLEESINNIQNNTKQFINSIQKGVSVE